MVISPLYLTFLSLVFLPPKEVTFHGRNFDILIGISAPLAAWAVQRWGLGPRFSLIWNTLGIIVLCGTILVISRTVPGPLFAGNISHPFIQFAEWPVIWIPAFLAPFAIFLHIFSVRQAVNDLRNQPTPNLLDS